MEETMELMDKIICHINEETNNKHTTGIFSNWIDPIISY